MGIPGANLRSAERQEMVRGALRLARVQGYSHVAMDDLGTAPYYLADLARGLAFAGVEGQRVDSLRSLTIGIPPRELGGPLLDRGRCNLEVLQGLFCGG